MEERASVDLDALYAALDAAREDRRLSWREVARQVGTSPTTFTRLGQGRGTDADTFAGLVAWLGVSADTFLRGTKQKKNSGEPGTVAAISAYLRADRSLRPEQTEALDKILRSAYRALRAGRAE